MKALVYQGPGQKAWEDAPQPTILRDTDAIVRVDAALHLEELWIRDDQFESAYDLFARAGDTGALKVVLTRA